MPKEEKERKKMVVEEVSDTSSIVDKIPEAEKLAEEITLPAEEIKPTPEPLFSPEQPSANPLWIIIPGIFLLGALLGGIFFYQSKVSQTPKNSPTPSDMPQVDPTPTPVVTAKTDLTKFKISILNGSGIGGEAGKAKTLLTDEGFTIASAGNASSYGFTKTIISAKSTVDKEFLDSLTASLSKMYVVGTNIVLPDTSKEEVVVTVGTSKK